MYAFAPCLRHDIADLEQPDPTIAVIAFHAAIQNGVHADFSELMDSGFVDAVDEERTTEVDRAD